MFTRFIAGIILVVLSTKLASGDQRTWVDSTGKHRVEAEYVSLKDDVVTLRNSAGKLVAVPLNRLSQDDRDFIRQISSPSNEKVASATVGKPATAKPIARRFYFGLVDQDFESIKPLLSPNATSNWDATKTQLETLEVPDGRQAVLVRTATIDDGMAVVNVSIKVRGKYLKQHLKMRWSDDAWHVATLVPDDEESEPVNFEGTDGDRDSRLRVSRRNDEDEDLDESDEDLDENDEEE